MILATILNCFPLRRISNNAEQLNNCNTWIHLPHTHTRDFEMLGPYVLFFLHLLVAPFSNYDKRTDLVGQHHKRRPSALTWESPKKRINRLRQTDNTTQCSRTDGNTDKRTNTQQGSRKRTILVFGSEHQTRPLPAVRLTIGKPIRSFIVGNANKPTNIRQGTLPNFRAMGSRIIFGCSLGIFMVLVMISSNAFQLHMWKY